MRDVLLAFDSPTQSVGPRAGMFRWASLRSVVATGVALTVFAGVGALLWEYGALVAAEQRLRQAVVRGVDEAQLPQASPYSVRQVVEERLQAFGPRGAALVVKVDGQRAASTDWLEPGQRVAVEIRAPHVHLAWTTRLFSIPDFLAVAAEVVVP